MYCSCQHQTCLVHMLVILTRRNCCQWWISFASYSSDWTESGCPRYCEDLWLICCSQNKSYCWINVFIYIISKHTSLVTTVFCTVLLTAFKNFLKQYFPIRIAWSNSWLWPYHPLQACKAFKLRNVSSCSHCRLHKCIYSNIYRFNSYKAGNFR